MKPTTLGILLAAISVTMEAFQFVFFGGLFQQINSFLFGFLVFGFTTVVVILWTAIFSPNQIRAALTNYKTLIAVNIGAVVTFTAYLISVQLIEPAITYTVSSGLMPLTAYFMYRFGMREGDGMRNRSETLGLILILIATLTLSLATIAGLTGFVRGGPLTAVLGITCAALDGVFFTLILVYSQRLNVMGVGPGAVLGLRLPLYVFVTGGLALGASQTSLPYSQIALFVAVGFLLTIPPLYVLQRAVPLISTLTLSMMMALGPFVIFVLQLFEGRVDYATATLVGLALYFSGAILSAIGSVKASGQDPRT